MAQSALVHTNDTHPGITRRALKRGWAYYDGDGARITDRDEIDRLEGELASRNEDDALEQTRELLRNAGKNMNALEERRRAEVEALQREVARLGALVEASSSGGDEG